MVTSTWVDLDDADPSLASRRFPKVTQLNDSCDDSLSGGLRPSAEDVDHEVFLLRKMTPE